MGTYTLTSDQVAALAAQLPGMGPQSGMLYSQGVLTTPSEMDSQIASVMAGLNWQSNGAKSMLLGYAQAKQSLIMHGGISVNVGSGGSPQNVEASTDATSLTLLQGAYALAQANGAASFQWVQSNGAAVTLTAAQIITIFNAVTAFVQSTFTQLAAVVAAIAAGSIASTAQVDTPPTGMPAWPGNS